jgi:cell division protease FtsH
MSVKKEKHRSPTKPDRPPGNQGQRPDLSGQGGGDGNWRPFVVYGLILLLFPVILILYTQGNPKAQDFSYHQFDQLLNDGRIVSADIHSDSSGADYIKGQYRPEGPEITDEKALPYYRVVANLRFDPALKDRLVDKKVKYNVERDNPVWATLWAVLPFILILVILWFFFARQISLAGRGAMAFGKSRAKLMTRDKNKITFKDVAGVDEAKDEVQEIVEFLKDPKRFQRLGGRMPKGILMVGAPGTGKTMLAKAIAGEADVPFFSISGSSFVEMFVGVGASRVRAMFEQGRRNAPCLIFIDEIDAVGRHRGAGLGGGHDEREQTLNALLVEMDGFDTTEGVVIIAATNRRDVLDPALLRPGRFDREVVVPMPDIRGREEILKVHSRKVKMSTDVDLSVIARATPGYSGAELANVINEAALLAARRGKNAVQQEELDEAREKVRWGRERRSLALSEKEKENTAYHEAGHAIVFLKLEQKEKTDQLHKVSIIPRGPALGVTMWLPVDDKYTSRRLELLDDIAVGMAGRIAEEIKFGDVTNGAVSDIHYATKIARKMVCEWGMSDKIGMVEFADQSDHVFLGRELTRSIEYSEDTSRLIDSEIKRIISEQFDRAKAILLAHKDKLEMVAKALLEYETLTGKQIKDILDKGHFEPPPKPPASAKPAPTDEKVVAKPKEKEGPAPGGLSPAPAV